MTDDQRPEVPEPRFQSQQEDGFLAGKLMDRPDGFHAHRIGEIGHGVDEVLQNLEPPDIRALDQGQERVRPQMYRRIFLTAVYRLHLDVT